MIRKIIYIIGVVFLLFFVGCSSTSPTPEGATSTPEKQDELKTFDIKYACFAPATHAFEVKMVEEYFKTIEKETNGRVTFTTYFGGTLLGAPEMYNGIVNGVADMGTFIFSYNSGRFPVSEVFELPGLIYKNTKIAGKVAWEGIKELNPKELQDTKLMFVYAMGPGHLLSKNPIRQINDLKSMEIKASGKSLEAIEALGGVPIALATTETYEAMQKGIVKGALLPTEALMTYRLAEVSDYIIEMPFLYNALVGVTMNLDVWNSLPSDIQNIIEDINEKIHESIIALGDEKNQEGLNFAIEQTDPEIIILSDEEIAKALSLIAPIQDKFVAEMEEKGLPGKVALDTVKRLIEHYDGVY